MNSFSELLSRLRSLSRNLFSRSRVEHDLDANLRSYADLLTDEKVHSGLSTGDARRAALVELGGIERVKEEVRDARVGDLASRSSRSAHSRSASGQRPRSSVS